MAVGDHTLFIARVVDAYARRNVFSEIYLPQNLAVTNLLETLST